MFQEEEELAYGAVSEEANLGDVLAAAPSMPEDDASIQVQQNEEMPIETGATADDLLLYNAEKEEEIPFVDLSISEEE